MLQTIMDNNYFDTDNNDNSKDELVEAIAVPIAGIEEGTGHRASYLLSAP